MEKKEGDKTLKKDKFYTALVVETGVDVRKSAEHTPFYHLGSWDFTVLFLAVFLRFLVETNVKQYKIDDSSGQKFNYKTYFDFKHLIRWVIHLISAVLGLLVLPEIFISYVYKKYEIGITDWSLLGTLTIGFVGYDMIRVSEKIFLAILNKTVGYKPDEKND